MRNRFLAELDDFEAGRRPLRDFLTRVGRDASPDAMLSDEVRELLRRMREEAGDGGEGLPPEVALLLDFARAAVRTPRLRSVAGSAQSLDDVLNVLALDRLVATGTTSVEKLDLTRGPTHALRAFR